MDSLTLQDVLRGGRQCDEDGTEIIMSRQACCVAADLIDKLQARVAELEDENAGLVAACDSLECSVYAMTDYVAMKDE